MLRLLVISIGISSLFWPGLGCAQDAPVSLGALARTLRAEKHEDQAPIIDNDNLAIMMDKAEAERLNGKPVFSIDPSGQTFRMTSPDGSCSLSFDAKATALISTPHPTSSLPDDALAQLNGEAVIHDNAIEVSLHNGTDWDVREIVVGVTVLNKQGPLILQQANLLLPSNGITTKTPDVTLLYHLKATAAPGESTVFRGTLDQDFGPNVDWHWALVGARGVPPAAPPLLAAPTPAASTDVSSPSPAMVLPAAQNLSPATAASRPKESEDQQH